MAKYLLTREKFLNYYPQAVWELHKHHNVIEDLIKGSEFILTAQDILDSMTTIEGKLVGVNSKVPVGEIELVFELPKEDLITE
jgi:hypothetical protein